MKEDYLGSGGVDDSGNLCASVTIFANGTGKSNGTSNLVLAVPVAFD